MTDLIAAPTVDGVIPQQFIVEPLGGPKDVFYYMDRFPAAIYRKTPDAHLYKFLRTLLGEQGVNWIKKNYLLARLVLEELNVDLFDLDQFYGSPLQFGRIMDESFEGDFSGLIPRDQLDAIEAKNARYRNRALDFVNGARAGNTPEGMRLVARSGLGHDVEIIENYKHFFDMHSDDQLGLPYFGRSTTTNEFIVLPRREVARTITQHILITATGGYFTLTYNGNTTAHIAFNASAYTLKAALEALPQIGVGNVAVRGQNPAWHIDFVRDLGNDSVYDLTADSFLTGTGASVAVTRTTTVDGSGDQIASFSTANEYHLQQALDRIRPVNSVYSVASSRGTKVRKGWNSVSASSEYNEVSRHVTGSLDVIWPTPSSIHWIEPGIEKEAPKTASDLSYHYQGFQNIAGVTASSVGVRLNDDETTTSSSAEFALADYSEPLFVTTSLELPDHTAASFINGIYPTDYQTLPGSPAISYNDQYWQSADAPLPIPLSDPLPGNGEGRSYFEVELDTGETISEQDTAETLVIDLGSVCAINNVSLEVFGAPLRIDVEYDLLDAGVDHNFVYVTSGLRYNNLVAEGGGWIPLGLSFTNAKKNMIFAQFLRVTFTRLRGYTGPVMVRNARVARNLA